jgi:hypothetical protein
MKEQNSNLKETRAWHELQDFLNFPIFDFLFSQNGPGPGLEGCPVKSP